MLMYRLLMFSMVLQNLTKIIPRIILLALYVVSVALLISFFNGDGVLSIRDSIYHPVRTGMYLYQYMRWWLANRDNLDLPEMFFVIVSLVAPALSFFSARAMLRFLRRLLSISVKTLFSKISNSMRRSRPNKENLAAKNTQQDVLMLKRKMMEAAEHKIDEHLANMNK